MVGCLGGLGCNLQGAVPLSSPATNLQIQLALLQSCNVVLSVVPSGVLQSCKAPLLSFPHVLAVAQGMLPSLINQLWGSPPENSEKKTPNGHGVCRRDDINPAQDLRASHSQAGLGLRIAGAIIVQQTQQAGSGCQTPPSSTSQHLL